ncbi:Photosystem I reaction centre subunit N (PSAN or PSI-N) [Carex littledalei]|uniref:Photosystem I reaction centre subunit N (PSAN or PSI-N) n=1 Tax=Carex littledalei TaxID=544730 RepID=A0A833UYP0_9POAL|nr:Photosystem I reaction centre subunit N (PSAN or PSI-N) [Carex littledalei]
MRMRMVSSPASTQVANSKLKPIVNKSSERVEFSRRIVLPLLISVAAVPDASESQKALLQEYLKRSKENKAKYDKERLDSYNKRNYKDYFEFIEGSIKDKDKDQLTESEKGILEWLRKNKE